MTIAKKIATVCASLSLCLLIGTSASAAVQCKEGTVTQVGDFPALANGITSKYLVQIDCADDTKWAGEIQFMLTTDLGDSGYATLLTAVSLNMPVNVTVEGTSFRSLLTRIYLTSN